jgi:ATP-dependent Lon protease
MPKESPAPPVVPGRLPVLEVEERAVFPYALTTLSVSLQESRPLLEEAHTASDLLAIFPVPAGARRPSAGPGVVASVLRLGAGPGGIGHLLVQGVCRAHLTLGRKGGPVRHAKVRVMGEIMAPSAKLALAALRRAVLERLDQLAGTPRGVTPEVRDFLSTVDDPGRFADLVSAQLDLPFAQAAGLLSEPEAETRLKLLLGLLGTELEIQALQERLNRQTRDEMDKRQREYFLRQQLEAIQTELSGGEGGGGDAENGYRKRLEALPAPDEVKAVLEKELTKLGRLSPFSEEVSQLRAYLDLVFDLPWGVHTADNLDLAKAQRDLDRDHYGLKKVKERILEYLAVAKLRGAHPGTLFCLVGPPGVGKTSLGRAVARTVGRRFVRMSLGGVRDEAEIRGHRRTYVGAMPGRIVQGIKNAGSMNPVFVLDEVDKMGSDWRGDPSSALLEALDPEQNREFVDHHLGFPFDLSKVMFIATANTLDGIHPALMDRLEVVELPGYTEEEKLSIAKSHLLPRIMESHGLQGVKVDLPDATLAAVIRRYTREAGVRNLERSIESLFRKVARKVAQGGKGPFRIEPGDLVRYLGLPRFLEEPHLLADHPGVATGLAWTETGGEILHVEATAIAGSGTLTLTGQLGEVMRESAQAALTYIKEHLSEWGLDPKALAKMDLHIHVPEGAIPKDGPSAGVTMAVSILSTLTGRPVPRDMAFSGEITLRGAVLPVGGLRDKLLAAQRHRIRTVFLPAGNRHERRELPESVRKGLELVWVKTVSDVFKRVIPKPKPKLRRKAAAGHGKARVAKGTTARSRRKPTKKPG